MSNPTGDPAKDTLWWVMDKMTGMCLYGPESHETAEQFYSRSWGKLWMILDEALPERREAYEQGFDNAE